jgi:hypothetical protein
MENRPSKFLSILAILTPIVYLILAVINYNTPIGKFNCWVTSTFVSEIIFYMVYIVGIRKD